MSSSKNIMLLYLSLTNHSYNDIIISNYQDIIISLKEVISLNKKLSIERDKQVQFRMPEKTHKKMKIALTKNDTGFADFFNKVSEAYLKSPKECQNAINRILGKEGE